MKNNLLYLAATILLLIVGIPKTQACANYQYTLLNGLSGELECTGEEYLPNEVKAWFINTGANHTVHLTCDIELHPSSSVYIYNGYLSNGNVILGSEVRTITDFCNDEIETTVANGCCVVIFDPGDGQCLYENYHFFHGVRVNYIDRFVKSVNEYYNNLNIWIPYCNLTPNEPLKNSPIKTIEVSFHVFQDDNGGNNVFTDTVKLKTILDNVNLIFAGNPLHGSPGPSDPVPGVVELPGYDTRIRFTLGDNNERIYFYRNDTLNKSGTSDSFYDYISVNYPERADKLNVYFTASYKDGKIMDENIEITNSGAGYTSAPKISFEPEWRVEGSAIVVGGKVTGIDITNPGKVNTVVPPIVTITGGGGFGAAAMITKVESSVGAYANFPQEDDLALKHFVVILQCADQQTTDSDIWILGKALAHELGHNLGLAHTFEPFGNVGCSDYCAYRNCDKEGYLADIFGDCEHSTVPHLHAGWSNDPYSSTNDLKTNNLMGGSNQAIYISPMQAGQMHRELATKSIRKYVKKETYSPIPLVIDSSEIWAFNLKLYRDVEVATGAVLTLADDFDFPYNGKITVKSGAALVIEKNVKLTDNNTIIVEDGGTLRFAPGSTIEVSGNGYIELQSGSYFCVPSNNSAIVKLVDANSQIKLMLGYRRGVNTSLLPSSDCSTSPIGYPVTGSGKIVESDVYLQNRTFTTTNSFVGQNVHIGYDVIPSSSPTKGNVILEPGSNVTVKATDDVYIKNGFEVKKGATFTTIPAE